jgi:hypothetical protein
LETEGEPVAVGHPKHQAAGKVSQNVEERGKRSKKKTPPDVPSPIPSEADPSLFGAIFPVHPCHVAWVSILLDLSWSIGIHNYFPKMSFITDVY